MHFFNRMLHKSFFSNTVETYLISLVILLTLTALLFILRFIVLVRLNRLAERTASDLNDFLIYKPF